MEMRPDPIQGIRSKIDRVTKHLADLDASLNAFMASRPYEVAARRSPQTRRLEYFMARVEEVPTEVTQIAGDILGNMAAVLDHLAYRLFLKNTSNGRSRSVYFPITPNASTRDDYLAKRESKVRGIDPHIVIPAIDALEPYRGGKGNLLCVLSELNNLSKHRDLIAVGSAYRNVDFGAYIAADMEKEMGSPFPALELLLRPADSLCPLKPNDVLFRDLPDADFLPNLAFTFEVALHEPEILPPKSLRETLHSLRDTVLRIVDDLSKHL